MTELHQGSTFGELVVTALRRYPDHVAFRQDGVALTYREVADMLARWVSLFRKRGIGADQGVGILSKNRPEVVVSQFASVLAGSRYTSLHPLGSIDDHLLACDEAKLRVLCVDPFFAGRAQELLDRSSAVEEVFTFGPAVVGTNIHALADQIGQAVLDPGTKRPEDLAAISYTGGTTGVPKGVMLPDRAFVNSAMGVSAGFDLPSDIRYLAAAPLSHGASIFVLPTLLAGGTIVIQNGFDPGAWIDAVEAEKITLAFLVPSMIYMVLDHPRLAQRNLCGLKSLVYGGSPMAPARLAEGIERLGPVFSQMYGLTECRGVATFMARAQHDLAAPQNLQACGMELPGVRVALLDDDGQEVPTGARGELCIQGQGVMQGYLNQPELTAETLRGGWLHTGDIALRDGAGLLHIVGRKKDMIISGGFNVFPSEIENVLSTHRSVAMSAVIGVPDDKWGEAVKAIVVPKPGERVDIPELLALVREKKGPAYTPKTVEIVDALPLTSVGKPDKKALRERFRVNQPITKS